MALYPIYATTDDLASYLDVSVSSLPANSNNMLKRASELIKRITLNNLNINNPDHMEAVKLATCAQVEYWIELGINPVVINSVSSYNAGSMSVNFNTASIEQISLRSRGYLNDQRLLYRGIKVRGPSSYVGNGSYEN